MAGVHPTAKDRRANIIPESWESESEDTSFLLVSFSIYSGKI